MIQAGTTNSPTQAIPAAISTNTSLLLGLFLSSDQAVFSNELAALSSAISTYGQDFVELTVAISVGSEDLYRISPIGVENESGAGVGPAQVVKYLDQVRSLVARTPARGRPIGHVDTWTAWVNSSNNAVIDASDFIGMDAYPYFQNAMSNAISNGNDLFFGAYNATVAVSGGKAVWITETGWPVSGPNVRHAGCLLLSTTRQHGGLILMFRGGLCSTLIIDVSCHVCVGKADKTLGEPGSSKHWKCRNILERGWLFSL